MLCPEESGYPGHLTGVVKRLPPEIASLATACTYLCTYVHRCKGCLQNFDAPETFSPLAFRLQTVCVFRTFYRKSISAELKVHDYVPLKTPRKVILKTLCLQEGFWPRLSEAGLEVQRPQLEVGQCNYFKEYFRRRIGEKIAV
jgi:hypothetical protein